MTSLLPLDPECWCCLLWPVTGDTRATYVARLEANHGWARGRHVHLKASEPLRLPQSAYERWPDAHPDLVACRHCATYLSMDGSCRTCKRRHTLALRSGMAS